MVIFVLENSFSSKKNEFVVVVCGLVVGACFLKQSFLGFLR
jgi:hypothetical protein